MLSALPVLCERRETFRRRLSQTFQSASIPSLGDVIPPQHAIFTEKSCATLQMQDLHKSFAILVVSEIIRREMAGICGTCVISRKVMRNPTLPRKFSLSFRTMPCAVIHKP